MDLSFFGGDFPPATICWTASSCCAFSSIFLFLHRMDGNAAEEGTSWSSLGKRRGRRGREGSDATWME